MENKHDGRLSLGAAVICVFPTLSKAVGQCQGHGREINILFANGAGDDETAIDCKHKEVLACK